MPGDDVEASISLVRNTHSEFTSSLIFMRETYELFSRESMQTGQTDPQKIRSDQFTYFPGNEIVMFSFSIKNRLIDHFASSVVSTRKTRHHVVAFSRLKELGPIQTW